MGLVQNGYRDAHGCLQFAGAGFSNGAYPAAHHYNFHQTGRNRNLTAGEGITNDKVGVPVGATHPVIWILPQKPGLISARAQAISIVAQGLALAGYPIEGSADITISIADAHAELIAFGIGSSTVDLSATGTLSGSINGIGSATVSVAGNESLLGAVASGEGSAEFALSATATILPIDDTEQMPSGSAEITISGSASALPLDDTPPARGASATFVITGSLVPYAVGHMVGNALPYTELSPQSLASAVWQSPAVDNNIAGTMGNKLNTASSGGVDMEALAEAVWGYERG